jgi:hypothetical protein
MKKKYAFILLCCCSLLFMGCPYNSETPIDTTPSVKIDAKLLGKWQQRSSEDITYVVTKNDEFTYSILEKHKAPKDGSKPEDDKTYNAFLSDVDGVKFLNLFEPGQDTKSYYFYKLEFSEETEGFTLFPVTEYITEKFTSSAEIKKFFSANKGLSFFYGTKDEYIKVGK